MAQLARRSWVPELCEDLVQSIAQRCADSDVNTIADEISDLVEENLVIHDRECINLNPATNTMNPRAEAVLSQGLGARPSLGYPGEKYEMGLEAIERIEVIAAELAAEVFGAKYAEIRVGSGALSNLYSFMATTKPGDAIIVQPADIGGHVTHHDAGAAGLYGLDIHTGPVDAQNYTVDLEGLRKLARKVQPKLITLAGSLNLTPHPVREVREIADEVGAYVLFDAAHLCGMIAGRQWQQPLDEGAHLMTMSTYKSLGGPASGLILTNEAELAERLDAIAFPGLTANFDVAKSAALALTMLDWKVFGEAYAKEMGKSARSLAQALANEDVPVFGAEHGFTQSHQFALDAVQFGGGQTLAKALRRANILTCGIGLPLPPVEGDVNGLRLGTPEVVRWGMTSRDMPELAELMARIIVHNETPELIRQSIVELRKRFGTLTFIR
ncbi:MAG: aminotransferase class I/II-fold pyridoxal phosphate-dependent enzyme [Hyphomicrobiaceae bacterium]|nr:aminotransferase class I/II-fold pyridoxal phosphate-dependent enzyme [Hyphomicrobiaceae bacterium]